MIVTVIDALELGLLGVAMGAGRTRADQVVHPAIGIVMKAHVGENVQKGEALAELHLREDADLDAFSVRVRMCDQSTKDARVRWCSISSEGEFNEAPARSSRIPRC